MSVSCTVAQILGMVKPDLRNRTLLLPPTLCVASPWMGIARTTQLVGGLELRLRSLTFSRGRRGPS